MLAAMLVPLLRCLHLTSMPPKYRLLPLSSRRRVLLPPPLPLSAEWEMLAAMLVPLVPLLLHPPVLTPVLAPVR